MADEPTEGGIPHGRDFAEYLRRSGVRDRTGLEMFPNVSLVSIVDDAHNVTRPLLPFVGVLAAIPTAVPGEWVGIQIQVKSAGGAFIENAVASGACTVVRSANSFFSTVASSPAIQSWSPADVPSVSTAQVGSRAVDPVLSGGWLSANSGGANMLPMGLMYVPPNFFVATFALIVGTTLTMSMVVREIA